MTEQTIIGGGESFQQAYLHLYMADALLALHSLFVMFVVLGLILVFIGNWLTWQWVRNPWFRYLHLAAIGIVVVQAWLGLPCPLTVWENSLRAQADDLEYAAGFMAHWMAKLIYYQAPAWVFNIAYSLFGLLTLLSLFLVKPRRVARAIH